MRAPRLLLVGLALLTIAATEPSREQLVEDSRSIERLINSDYAYLERFPGGRAPLTDALRAEAESIADKRGLVRFAERAMLLLADHHAITGASMRDSWALVPSFSDLWVEPHQDGGFVITSVRRGSPGERAGIRAGDRLVAVGGQPIRRAIDAFWSDLGSSGGNFERDGFAARILAAGRRDRPRDLSVADGAGRQRRLTLPSLYSIKRDPLPPVSIESRGRERILRFNDSLGDTATIAAFDQAMAAIGPKQRLVLDLGETPSGGNTTVARAVLGWFVDRPTSYQVHSLPAELQRTGVARQWVEQVLPRAGKRFRGPVTVRVGRWTGSMGEGMAVGFDALGVRVEGEPMAGLLGAIYDVPLKHSGFVLKFPVERLSAVDGTPREKFLPSPRGDTR